LIIRGKGLPVQAKKALARVGGGTRLELGIAGQEKNAFYALFTYKRHRLDFSEIFFFRKMVSKLSVAFSDELIRAALARRILVMAITPLSSGLARCLHHIFGLCYH
jgi:hypothetical protein